MFSALWFPKKRLCSFYSDLTQLCFRKMFPSRFKPPCKLWGVISLPTSARSFATFRNSTGKPKRSKHDRKGKNSTAPKSKAFASLDHRKKSELYPYAMTLMYDGSRYRGNAYTPNASDTVTNELTDAFSAVLESRIDLTETLPLKSSDFQLKWTSRTDTGVHALHNLLTCFLPLPHWQFVEKNDIKVELIDQLNQTLPFDVKIRFV